MSLVGTLATVGWHDFTEFLLYGGHCWAFLASFGPGTQVGRSPASAVGNQGLPIFDHIHEYVHSCRLCGFQSPSSGCVPRRGIERSVRGHRPRSAFVARIRTNGGGTMKSIPSRRSAAPAGLSPLHHTKPTPEADAPNQKPAERQIFFTPGFLRYLGDVPKNSRKIQGRVCRVFYL